MPCFYGYSETLYSSRRKTRRTDRGDNKQIHCFRDWGSTHPLNLNHSHETLTNSIAHTKTERPKLNSLTKGQNDALVEVGAVRGYWYHPRIYTAILPIVIIRLREGATYRRA